MAPQSTLQRRFRWTALAVVLWTGLAAGNGGAVPEGADLAAIVARMEVRAKERAKTLGNYRSVRDYRVSNPKMNFQREYPITMECLWPYGKKYHLPDPPPTGTIFKMVFKRLLDSEVDNARPGIQQASVITSANYQFALEGQEEIAGEPCWKLALKPKRKSKFLLKGRFWLSCADAEIVRLEGRPAEMPSFWVKDIQLVRTFQKVGKFWLPRSDRTVNQLRVFGETRFEIDYRDYSFGAEAAPPGNKVQSGTATGEAGAEQGAAPPRAP